jgi:hypothetical protein
VCCGHGGAPLCDAGKRPDKDAATNRRRQRAAKDAAAGAAAAAAAARTWRDAAPRKKKRGAAATEDAKTPKARSLRHLRGHSERQLHTRKTGARKGTCLAACAWRACR